MLPKLPVPDLRHTLDAYLRSVKHLVPEAQLLKTPRRSGDVQQHGGAGERLQTLLLEKRDKTRELGAEPANILRFIIKVH